MAGEMKKFDRPIVPRPNRKQDPGLIVAVRASARENEIGELLYKA